MSISAERGMGEDVGMEQTAKTEPATGRRLVLVTPLRPLDREAAIASVRRARMRVEHPRFSREWIAEREGRFAHLKRTYD
jgi:hypothetical protein